MPTYRNNSNTAINYNHNGRLYSFPPHKDYEAIEWLPYQELGLELVSADYPPVPESILLSGSFTFERGMERKFNIRHCERYKLNITVKSGKVRMYTGNAKIGLEVSDEYSGTLDWERAPYIRILSVDVQSEVKIDAEVVK